MPLKEQGEISNQAPNSSCAWSLRARDRVRPRCSEKESRRLTKRKGKRARGEQVVLFPSSPFTLFPFPNLRNRWICLDRASSRKQSLDLSHNLGDLFLIGQRDHEELIALVETDQTIRKQPYAIEERIAAK